MLNKEDQKDIIFRDKDSIATLKRPLCPPHHTCPTMNPEYDNVEAGGVELSWRTSILLT